MIEINNMSNKVKGFTLIEVMIAVVVFSFGLLGIAGVMTVSVKNNHNGYMRSQAAFLASSMIELMRQNQIGLWSGSYDGTYTNFTALTSSNDCSVANACDSDALVTRDVTAWSNMIFQILPNSSGQVECASPGAPSTAIPIMVIDPLDPRDVDGNPTLPLIVCENCAMEPYNGFCTVTVNWTESNSISSSSAQSLVLVGKP